MTGLKVILWLTGIMCLLAIIGLFISFTTFQNFAGYFGVEQLQDTPFMNYLLRVLSVTFAAIGIYFIILATAPLRYGVLIPFSAIASIIIGAACLITGYVVKMPAKWFMADALACLILGVLIYIFWFKAKAKPVA
ncbi:MAG: BphX family protein [Phycisphaerae bacterium]|jgi:hypothetical protein